LETLLQEEIAYQADGGYGLTAIEAFEWKKDPAEAPFKFLKKIPPTEKKIRVGAENI
jgi:hypothetical protein